MKHRTLRAVAAALSLLIPSCITSCTSPFGLSQDPFRLAQGMAMQGQVAAHQQASLAMAGQQLQQLAPMRTIPVQPIRPLRYLKPAEE